MALNVSYNFQQQQNPYSGIDSKTLKSTAKEILEKSQAKSAEVLPRRVDIDLYNGEIDALTAKNVAMSNSGLQVTLNNNLETAIRFLKTKAAEARKSSTMADVISINSAKKDKQGSNPFNNGEIVKSHKEETDFQKKEDFLFITVA
ncbi:MAG: hypothetical protein ACI37S_02130 [Candidatus Gastranaerophilaceae bacterium]